MLTKGDGDCDVAKEWYGIRPRARLSGRVASTSGKMVTQVS